MIFRQLEFGTDDIVSGKNRFLPSVAQSVRQVRIFVRTAGNMGHFPGSGVASRGDQTIHFDVGRKKSIRAVEEAMRNGYSCVIHLYSVMSTVTRDNGFRRGGLVEAGLLLDDLDVEIICDGKHLPPDLIRLIYRIKGPDKIALITDSLALAGTTKSIFI